MKHFLLGLLLALACLSASADVVAAKDGNVILLREQGQCPATIAKLALDRSIPAEVKMLPAEVTLGSDKYVACWFVYNDNVVVLLYEDGDVGTVPVGEFRKLKDA